MANVSPIPPNADPPPAPLKFLTPAQIERIDDMLSGLGDYGEVHLIVQHRQLRYINQLHSFRAWDASSPPKP